MDFSQIQFKSKLSREQLTKEIIGLQNFDEVYHYIKMNDDKLGNRVAWVLSSVHQHQQHWLPKYYNDMLQWVPLFKTQGIQRSILKMLAENDVLPAENESEWIDFCFDKLQNITTDVAVKVYSMELLCKFCIKYPDLCNEFKAVLNEGILIYSKAYSGRAKKILKRLGKLS